MLVLFQCGFKLFGRQFQSIKITMKSIKKNRKHKKIRWALELSETEIQQNDVKGAQLGSQSQLAQFFNTKSTMGQLPSRFLPRNCGQQEGIHHEICEGCHIGGQTGSTLQKSHFRSCLHKAQALRKSL